jgi:hypothetical protein
MNDPSRFPTIARVDADGGFGGIEAFIRGRAARAGT